MIQGRGSRLCSVSLVSLGGAVPRRTRRAAIRLPPVAIAQRRSLAGGIEGDEGCLGEAG